MALWLAASNKSLELTNAGIGKDTLQWATSQSIYRGLVLWSACFGIPSMDFKQWCNLVLYGSHQPHTPFPHTIHTSWCNATAAESNVEHAERPGSKEKQNEWCLRPQFCTILGQGQPGLMGWILVWTTPQEHDWSLGLLTCSPACYHSYGYLLTTIQNKY